jgi:peptidoglycan/xylan/chitin deacetylase (PgdA/CDA1 family)
MSNNRDLILVAWSGDRKCLGTRSLKDSFKTSHEQVIAERDYGLVWSCLFALPFSLPKHPALSKLAERVGDELDAHLVDASPSPIVRVYEQWSAPPALWNGEWKAADAAMLGWGTFQQRHIPVTLRCPWTCVTNASDLGVLFGKFASDMYARPSDEVLIAPNGMIQCNGPADPLNGGLFPQVYGRLMANQWIESERQYMSSTSTPPNETNKFMRAVVKGMQALGGKFVSADAPYEWYLNTPIGKLRYSFSPRTIFCRWDNVDEAVAQLGRDVNPHSGKWNHYVFDGVIGEYPTEDDAALLVKRIGQDIAGLRVGVEEEEGEGDVR